MLIGFFTNPWDGFMSALLAQTTLLGYILAKVWAGAGPRVRSFHYSPKAHHWPEGSQSGSTIILVLPALDTSLILRHNLGEKDRSVFLSQKLKV